MILIIKIKKIKEKKIIIKINQKIKINQEIKVNLEIKDNPKIKKIFN